MRTARMPLLKAKLSGGIELKVTLSPLDVSDIPACQTAELVSKTFKELPHARKLLLILKALMRPPNCLSALVGVHTGGVSSYTITLMVLAFCKFQVRQLFKIRFTRHMSEGVQAHGCLLASEACVSASS